MSLSSLMTHTTCQAFADRTGKTALHKIFNPSAVAVIGATDRVGAVGQTIVNNLKSCLKTKENSTTKPSFQIYPVNPTRDTCCGLKCYKSVRDCPAPVDLAVIVTPSKTVPGVVECCGQARVAVAIIISAGFKELGEEGLKLELELLDVARKYGMRIVGPNCLGIMAPHYALNATFAADHAYPGQIAFLSQSGAMCTAVLDWALKEQVGFSAFVSIGSMCDIEWGDFLEYFERDTQTKAIIIYMETIGNVAHFVSAARNVSMKKPIFVVKAGQTSAAASAAASHTGSLVGSHDAFLATMKRSGVMVLDSISELYDVTLILGKQPEPAARGNLTIITNAGGPGVLATDAAALNKATIHSLKESTIQALNKILPEAWSHANPIDVLGDASPALYYQAVKGALEDSDSDGILVILSPQSVTEPTPTAKAVIQVVEEYKKGAEHAQTGENKEKSPKKVDTLSNKTIICSWMGMQGVQEGYDLLNSHGIPTLSFPDNAAKMFGKLANYRFERTQLKLNLVKELEENSPLMSFMPQTDPEAFKKAEKMLKDTLLTKRTVLTEAESKSILRYYGLPVCETLLAKSCDEAVKLSKEVQYPCVVKLHSSTITHKSDVGGVHLDLKTPEDVKNAWNTIDANLKRLGKSSEFEGVTVQPMIDVQQGLELILGSFTDPQFGVLVLFGSGGCMVEVYKDSSLSIPPLDTIDAKMLIDSTKISHALQSIDDATHNETNISSRYVKIDKSKLIEIVCKFSYMVNDLRQYVAECDINPLLASTQRLVALDARFILRSPETDQIPSIPIAVPSYPWQYSKQFKTKESKTLIHMYVTNPSDFYRTKQFAHAAIMEAPELMKYREEGKVVSGPLKGFSFENHIMAHMLFSDYSRALPICCYNMSTKQFMGCAFLRRHPLVKTSAMLQFTFKSADPSLSPGDFQESLHQMIDHIIFITKAEGISFVFSQIFRAYESDAMKEHGFHVEQNSKTGLYLCTYESSKSS